MTDLIFGELREDKIYEGYSNLLGSKTIQWGGKPCLVELLLAYTHGTQITPQRYDAFECFIKAWPQIQPKLIQALIDYYNEEERFAWGPDDEEEFAAWWPEIQTEEALLKFVTLETILIPSDFVMTQVKKGRCIYLLFSRAWGGEDWDNNGIGVCLRNEEVDEIGYQDIAF